MKTVGAGILTVNEPSQDDMIVTVEFETDALLEQEVARVAALTGLSRNLVRSQAFMLGLLLRLMQ